MYRYTRTFKELSFTQIMIDTIYHPFYTHQHYQTLLQPTDKIYKTITHPTTSTIAPRPSYTHRQHKHTRTHYRNHNNLVTKDMHTSAIQPPQQTSHKLHQNRHQPNTIPPQHIPTSLAHPILKLFHQQISHDIINLILQRSNKAKSQKIYR